MAIVTRCNGCGKEWYERLGELPPPNHGHIAGELAIFLLAVFITTLVTLVVVVVLT